MNVIDNFMMNVSQELMKCAYVMNLERIKNYGTDLSCGKWAHVECIGANSADNYICEFSTNIPTSTND